jgi:hypothetical protein
MYRKGEVLPSCLIWHTSCESVFLSNILYDGSVMIYFDICAAIYIHWYMMSLSFPGANGRPFFEACGFGDDAMGSTTMMYTGKMHR